MVYNPHNSIEIRNSMASSPSSSSSLPTRRVQQKQKQKQKQKQRKETTSGGSCLNNTNDRRAALEQQARTFFQLANVCDRKESHSSRYSNGNSSNNRQHKLYRNVFAGSEAIDSMVGSGLAPSREKALQLGNKLASELNLFSRANHPSHPTKLKRKDRSNLMAAQTILLGASESESKRPKNQNLLDGTVGATNNLATATLAEGGCFADDANAFYRFGPGVLSILRGIDHDFDGIFHPTKKGATSETVETTSFEDMSFDSSNRSDGDLETKTKKKQMNGKKQQPTHRNRNSSEAADKRSLSITSNAPGCNGKVVLEDLFRDPAVMANNSNSNKPSKSSKKKTKKSAAAPHPSASFSPPPFPKSILKNCSSTNDNKNSKKKKQASSSSKTKKRSKKDRKLKAGAKVKYISENERRIKMIHEGLSICDSDQEVVKYGQMLQELEERVSNVYTGDHFESVSLSPHSSPRPKQEQYGNGVSAEEPPLDNKTCSEDVEKDDGDDNDDERNDTFDNALGHAFDNVLESLDDIISSNAGLLADGNDNASVWTEFIMGAESIKPNAFRVKKKEIRSTYTTPKAKATKLSKESPDKLRTLPAVLESEEPGKKHRPIEQKQQQQQKLQQKKRQTSTWQAPVPLESGGGGGKGSKNRNKARCDENEIDLSSWAIFNREKEGNELGEERNNPHFVPKRCLPPSFPLKKPSTIAMQNGTPDDLSLLTPDDLSLLMGRSQERERKSPQERDVTKSRGDTDKNPRRHENHTKIGPGNLPSGAFLAGTKNCADSTTGSIPSNATNDSNDLTRRRLVPRRKNGPDEKLPNLPEQEGITDGMEALYQDYHIRETNGKEAEKVSSDPTPLIPTSFDGDAFNASDDSSGSGIDEAIEQDTFFQQANSEAGIEPQTAQTKSNERAQAFDVSSPVLNEIADHSEPGSLTESYADSFFFEASPDVFGGDEDTYASYSDEGSYMELTVDDEEQSSEEIEEMMEEDLITVVSESDHNYPEYQNAVSQTTVSPIRRTAKFQAARYLPSVPEIGPEPEPEPEPQPTFPHRKQSVYIDVHSMPDDDEMTQITMDCFFSSSLRSNRSLHIIPEDDYTINNGDYANHNSYLFPLEEGQEVTAGGSAKISPLRTRDLRLMKNNLQFVPSTPSARQNNQFSAQRQLKQRTKQVTSSSALNRHGNTVLAMETSQQRIQDILWKDLSSSDVTAVWGGLEELRIIVATESRSRAYLVRHGGVMVIIDTMARQLEVEVIQFLCCNILEQLTSVDFEIGLTILELGGISLIEQSIKKHSGSRRVKEMGDVALATLSRNS